MASVLLLGRGMMIARHLSFEEISEMDETRRATASRQSGRMAFGSVGEFEEMWCFWSALACRVLEDVEFFEAWKMASKLAAPAIRQFRQAGNSVSGTSASVRQLAGVEEKATVRCEGLYTREEEREGSGRRVQ